jgi:hypothetical protein
MDFPEMVVMIVLISVIFATINNFIRRRYEALGRRRRGVDPVADQATGALVEIERLKQQERASARQQYERLAAEKMQVMRDAIAMGYQEAELKSLDARLEQLVGPERLSQLMEDTPDVQLRDVDLLDEDIQAEIDRLTEGKATN